MFGSLLGRKKTEISENDKNHSILVNKIDKMNLTEMRSYVKNGIIGLESSADGLNIVLEKIINKKAGKRYIESDDMDSKIKKAFELVLAIAGHKKITVVVIEQIQEFMNIYSDIIIKFDRDNKQIYSSRLKKAISQGITTVNSMTVINTKMKILEE
jgi:hypothetical protein